jgi:hypothetical protein
MSEFDFYPTIEFDVNAGRVIIGFRRRSVDEAYRHSLSALEAIDYASRILDSVRFLTSMRGEIPTGPVRYEPLGKYEDMELATDDRNAFSEIDR